VRARSFAERAGVIPGWEVLSINGVTIAGLSEEELDRVWKGPFFGDVLELRVAPIRPGLAMQSKLIRIPLKKEPPVSVTFSFKVEPADTPLTPDTSKPDLAPGNSAETAASQVNVSPARPMTVADAAAAMEEPAQNSTALDSSMIDVPPLRTRYLKPEYPMELRRGGIPGEVMVRFVVEADGSVSQAFAVRSSRREFERYALQAVRQWKFTPGTKAGVPVRTQLQVAVSFNVAEGDKN
jgi:protein TonB